MRQITGGMNTSANPTPSGAQDGIHISQTVTPNANSRNDQQISLSTGGSDGTGTAVSFYRKEDNKSPGQHGRTPSNNMSKSSRKGTKKR